MSVKKVLIYGDEILRIKSKEVKKISSKIKTLIANMRDTMYAQNGVGLAAPQIGENLRIFVIDVTEPDEPYNPIVFINPKIIEKSGAINSYEGCLSFPEAYTNVRRYKNIKVKATDINGKPFIIEAKEGCLLARAIQHEFDHLEGVLFVDHARNRFEADKILEEKGLNSIEPDRLIDENFMEDEIAKNENIEENK